MSAYLCSDLHINTLVSYAVRHGVHYRVNGNAVRVVLNNAEAIANILIDENARGVGERYRERTKEHFGDIGEALRFKQVNPLPDALVILKLCDCFDYQACESDDYEDTLAAEIVNQIRKEAIRRLPGYDAAPWGI
ncbi:MULTISPECIES: hypothetical protein [unclassified Bradyrhizobium]|uniref:hypothetical protein n=1 Tax=unclassified Bradyrhizobium TaxID=2631580 RepID=UPI002FF2BD57